MARDGNYMPIVIPSEGAVLGESVDIMAERTGPTYLIGHIIEGDPQRGKVQFLCSKQPQ